jgi:cyclophilin family peptidyl-prolyl cis-trans isomerase
MHQDYPLQPNYVIFAHVTNGMSVVDALANVETTMGSDSNMSKPIAPVVMRKVTIKP